MNKGGLGEGGCGRCGAGSSALGVLLAISLLVGCGSSDSQPSAAAPALNPPASINVKLCSQYDREHGSDCAACCNGAGYPNASYVYEDQCTCGPVLPHEIDKQTCAASSANADTCNTCCTNANYDSGILNTVDPCICFSLKNAAVCASAQQPDDGCAICCHNAGYFVVQNPANNGGACVCEE